MGAWEAQILEIWGLDAVGPSNCLDIRNKRKGLKDSVQFSGLRNQVLVGSIPPHRNAQASIRFWMC